MPKNVNKYICDKCSFKCSKKSNYNNHLLTLKHKRMILDDQKMPKNASEYSCDCGKTYKHRQGLYKHKKHCSVINNKLVCVEKEGQSTILNLISQNKELMNLLAIQNQEHKEETRELMKQNKEMQKTIQEIVPKIGNTNNTINNHFNIQNFLNEDCKEAINFSEFIENIKISFEDLEHQAEVGYVNGVSKLFIENLRDLGTHKRPIHCTDKKRKTLYIKENDEWDKEGSQNTLKKGIREVSRKGLKCLMKEKEENQEEYKDNESDFSQKCISIHRNILPRVPQESSINKVIDNISKTSRIL